MKPVVSHHARFFDPQNKNWNPTPEYNLTFLRSMANHFYDKLKAQGHIFVNEFYDELGIKRSTAGAIEGWLYDDRDTVKMFEVYMQTLDSNVQGFIVDFPNTSVIFEEIEDDEELNVRTARRLNRRYGPRPFRRVYED